MADYPARESHFAHKAVRLLVRTCAAQEIGSDAWMLVAAIVHTEDAKRYTGPVTFWNDQLQSILGLSWGKLDRARKRATEADWLHYEPGGKGKVGRYWVTIPPSLAAFPDGPADEDHPTILSTGAEENDLSSPPVEKEPGDNRGTTGGQPGDKCGTFYPSPNPSPKKDSPARSQASDARPSTYVFPTVGKGGGSWTLPQAKLDEYREAYPDLDLAAEMRAARQWCRDNATRRKTANGMLGFLTRWLNRAQNSSREARRPDGPTQPPLKVLGRPE